MFAPRYRHGHYRPRPGYQRASVVYRLGLPILRGYPLWVGPNYEYRQMHRRMHRRVR
jgi:hypothetical protein